MYIVHIHVCTYTYFTSHSKWIDGEIDVQQELKMWRHYVIVSKVLRQVRHPQFKEFWPTSILKMLHHLLLQKTIILNKFNFTFYSTLIKSYVVQMSLGHYECKYDTNHCSKTF